MSGPDIGFSSKALFDPRAERVSNRLENSLRTPYEGCLETLDQEGTVGSIALLDLSLHSDIALDDG